MARGKARHGARDRLKKRKRARILALSLESRARRLLSMENLTPSERNLLERLSRRWEKKFEPQRRAIRESQIITAEDLAVTINTRDDDPIPSRSLRRTSR